MRKYLLLLFSVCFAAAFGQQAKNTATESAVLDSVQLRVYFHQGFSDIDPSYRGNEERLANFVAQIRRAVADSIYIISDISITASASPEGNTLSNLRLSEARARSIVQYLSYSLDVPKEIFRINAIGEDWEGLRALIQKYNVPRYKSVVAIIDTVPQYVTPDGKLIDDRKRRLMDLDDGKVWDYMLKTIFPELRSGNNNVICHITLNPQVAPPTYFIPSTPPATNDSAGTSPQRPVPPKSEGPIMPPTVEDMNDPGLEEPAANADALRPRRHYRFAVKTNLLFDLVACPNIEVEFPIGHRYSLMAEHNFPWYVWHHNSYAYELLSTGLEARYWTGQRDRRDVLQGLFVGLYVNGVRYDFERKDKGYQSDFNVCAGVSVGKTWRLSDRWRLETSIGLGFMHTNYRYYERDPRIDLLIWQRNGSRNWIGPTKAKVAIGYLIGGKKQKKGGKQ